MESMKTRVYENKQNSSDTDGNLSDDRNHYLGTQSDSTQNTSIDPSTESVVNRVIQQYMYKDIML